MWVHWWCVELYILQRSSKGVRERVSNGGGGWVSLVIRLKTVVPS